MLEDRSAESMDGVYTLIYAFCFYLSSLLITMPFLKFFRHHEARMLSLLTLSASSFIAGMMFPFKVSVYSAFVALMILSIYVLHREKPKLESSEAIFAAVFTFFTILRFLNPHIFDAEKFMDSAFMNAVLKASQLPPNDPFLAGAKLDFYYYFGHLLSAVITLISFSPPEIGYNIAVAAVPAYTSLIIFGALREAGRRVAAIGVFLTVFSGNLYSFLDFFYRITSGKAIDFGYYWNCTRVVENTINEFPYFSFIHADLHAHVVAIPILALFIALISRREKSKAVYAAIVLSMFAIFATNSWYYPLAFFAALAGSLALRDKNLALLTFLSLIPVALLYLGMNTPAAEITLVEQRSDATQFLLYAFTPIAAAYIATARKFTLYAIPLSIPLYFISPILPILIPLAANSLHGIFKRDFFSALILSGVLAFAIPEFFAIESRLNTVFKFYLYAWIALMFSSAKFEWEGRKKTFIAAILLIGLVYPLAATPVRYSPSSTSELTLDGMSFMKTYDGDYYAVKWLQSRNGVVIEEGCTHNSLCGYSYGGRVAAFTGNPAVIAWTNHEYAWRRNYTLVAERAKDVRDFYLASTCEEMIEIVKKYGISYVFFGYEERRVFSVSEEKFERCFEKVFQSDGTYIFATKNLSFT